MSYLHYTSTGNIVVVVLRVINGVAMSSVEMDIGKLLFKLWQRRKSIVWR